MTAMTLGSCRGSYFQRILPLSFRSNAKTLFGNGVCTYMTLPMTNGPPSCPRSTPVEKLQTGCSLDAFVALIWSSALYR